MSRAPIRVLLISFVVLWLIPGHALDQQPVAKPNPQAPSIAMPSPLGIQRGSSVDFTLTGANLAEPTGLWTSFPAKVTIPTDNNNGKDNDKLRVRLEVPKDAPIGFHAIRLATRRGVSNFRLFCVDDLPQVLQSSKNHAKDAAQPVPVPCVVVGRVDPEVSDFYRIAVKAGQRLSIEILGRRLGSPFDPQLSLFDSHSSRELVYSNDAPGLQTDARLTYTFKKAGDYLIEVRDVMYRGGPDYWYRLRIGDFPCATTPIPMAARRGSRVKVRFAGPVVAGAAPVEVTMPTDPAATVVWITPRGTNGVAGWPVALAVSDLEEFVEHEPNDDPAHANRITIPCGVTGRFEKKEDADHYVFAAKKGQRLVIQAHTHDLFSPTEVYMVLKNAAGAQIATSNPAGDPQIQFTAPADGDYVLSVEHLNYWGGPEESYRLTFKPPEPGFDFVLPLDRFDVPQGGIAAVPIQTITRRDYSGPIEISLEGAPGISGQTLVTSTPPLGPNQPAAWLFISTSPNTALGPYACRVRGVATINNRRIVADAGVRAVVSQELAGLPYPPPDLTHMLGIGVTEKPPFTLIANFARPDAIRGGAVPLTIAATRIPGFDDEISLSALGLPATVSAALKNIPKGENEVSVQIAAAPNAPLGKFLVSFAGKAKTQNREFHNLTQPAPLTVTLPFELHVEPARLELSPGKKARIKVTVVRKGGYSGPIDLDVRNLPAKVTAPKVVIPPDRSAGEIELSAGADVPASEKADVHVLGVATAAGNQQNASPSFAIRIAKKEVSAKDTKNSKK
jgi:Bacterial pre-peptidase C-terminal domain